MILTKLKEKQIPYLIASKKIKNEVLALLLIGDFFLRKGLVKIKYLRFKRNRKIISLLRHFPTSADSVLKIERIAEATIFKTETLLPSLITKKDFDSHFNDIEDFFKLHRFNWLWSEYLTQLNPEALQEALSLILSWISKDYDMEGNKDIFESYSISERITSWIFFLVFSKGVINIDENDIKLISKSIIKQLNYLAQNLEFKGQLTNNHILKNAMALYVGGAFLSDEKIKELGKVIIIAEYDEHITDGYLQEDSTHYQFIVTRWFIEVFHASKIAKDYEFQKWLEPRLKNLLGVCRKTFLQNGTGPLFGDISPDFPVETFMSYPFIDIEKKSPWSFLLNGLSASPEVVNTKIKNVWIHKKIGKFDLFVMAKNKGIGSHGHEDNGSFVLFCEGSALVQDLGRKDYTGDHISIEQQKQAFHSMPCLGHRPWDIKTIPTIVKSLFISKFNIIQESEVLFRYRVSSFDGAAVIERTFQYNLEKENLILRDKLLSKKSDYVLALPLDCSADSLALNGSRVSFNTKTQKRYFISSDCKHEVQHSVMSKNYGKQEDCALLIFKKSLNPGEFIEYIFGSEDRHD
nr:hypothetical protein BHI3_03230 [Bacteriovorax sp. HI3]